MKTLITFLIAIISFGSMASENKYKEAMSKAVEKLNHASSINDFTFS